MTSISAADARRAQGRCRLADAGFVPPIAKSMAIMLTTREMDVLRLLARGCTYTQVGDRLGVTCNTVATHVKNIYPKLEVRSARAAIWRAFELRLLGGADA